MAKRKVSTFDLESDLKLLLKKSNFKTVEDVLSESFLQLMKKLHLSADETKGLIAKLSVACLPPCNKACDLISKEEGNSVPFGDPKLDLILRGGVQRGSLTEFTGPSGVGKTQMCFHLALQCLQMKCSQNGVCCIDTEGSFRPERLYEMMDQCPTLEGCQDFLAKFHIFQPKTVSSLNEILSKLEIFCIEKDVGLILVDSIASLVRKEFSQDTKFHRAAALSSWAAEFKALADQLNMSVIVTNQVTSRMVKDESSDEDDDEAKTEVTVREIHVVPALGSTWTHFVNTRFILQYLSSEERQLIVAKSPVAPIAVKNFRITRKGIEFAGDISYTFDGMNSSKHRIKIQPPF